MAQWANAQLDNGVKKIACLVPNLNSCKADLIRIFTNTLGYNLFESEKKEKVYFLNCTTILV